MTLPNVLYWSIPLFIVLTIAELFYARAKRRHQFDAGDTTASALLGLGRFAMQIGFGVLTYLVMTWVYQYRWFDIGYAWWAFVVLFFADDFIYYWWHRWSHEIRYWWSSHVVHHSSQHYNLGTAIRQSWSDTATWLFWTPLCLVGFPPLLVLFQISVNQTYQYFIHTEHVRRLPRWVEFVFNTPSHHRVHHASNPRYLDANYGGIFILWDRLFGTFVPEVEEEPCRYGLVRNVGTHNPVRIAFHDWVALWRDVRSAPTLRDKVGYLVHRPGWRHDGTGRTTAEIKAEWRARRTGGAPAHPAAGVPAAPDRT